VVASRREQKIEYHRGKRQEVEPVIKIEEDPLGKAESEKKREGISTRR